MIDNTHDIFSRPPDSCWSFTNLPKFVGLQDGAILSGPTLLSVEELPRSRPRLSHGVKRWFGASKQALDAFRKHEKSFGESPMRASLFSRLLMKNIDLKLIAQQRVENFAVLHENLAPLNLLDVSPSGTPFCYPLLLDKPVSREILASLRLFAPRYWDGLEGISGIPDWELNLSRCLIPLPIDHRYRREDMLIVARILRNLIAE